MLRKRKMANSDNYKEDIKKAQHSLFMVGLLLFFVLIYFGYKGKMDAVYYTIGVQVGILLSLFTMSTGIKILNWYYK